MKQFSRGADKKHFERLIPEEVNILMGHEAVQSP